MLQKREKNLLNYGSSAAQTVVWMLYRLSYRGDACLHTLMMGAVLSSETSLNLRFIILITQLQATTESSVKTLHEFKLRSGHERVSSLLILCIVYVPQLMIIFLCGYVKFGILYKSYGLRLTICKFYSWETALNVGPYVSFDKMYEWKGIREKTGEVNSMDVYKEII
jgi:hypothetical protein